jgi:hypothetical protein
MGLKVPKTPLLAIKPPFSRPSWEGSPKLSNRPSDLIALAALPYL